MKNAAVGTELFVFNAPAPELLEPMPTEYYRECQLAGAGSVEIKLRDHSTVIISATRYLSVDAGVAAAVANGVLQVLCTRTGREPVIMREFIDWTRYTVHRAA